MNNQIITAKNRRYYYYLFELQASGRTNMYGASWLLQDRFGLDKHEAQQVVSTWMERYEQISRALGNGG